MKKIFVLGCILISMNTFSQIISPNGDNIFYYDGGAEVNFRYQLRGSGGRAFVHAPYNILSINHEEDFTGGTRIGRSVFFKDDGNSYISSGNFGIGTSTPNSKLVVMNNNYGISINPNSEAAGLGFNRNAVDGSIYNSAISAWQFSARNDMFTLEGYNGAPSQLLSVVKNGNVGVGTFYPSAKLDVRGSILVWGQSVANEDHGQVFFENENHGIRRIGNVVDIFTSGGEESGFTFTPRSYNSSTNSYSNMNVALKINSSGNVGIGILNPSNKLDVNGTIHSKEVKVDMYGWSDFVFKKEYTLPTLEEVEKHISEKGHLQNIPSEEEVLENGINLGEMNSKLLQKIEELTLYMIEMKKENEAVKKENVLMKDHQIELEKRISKIENKTL